MPFEPDPNGGKYQEPCRHPEHFPPSHMVWQSSGWWVCAGCGNRFRIYPNRVML